MSNILRDNLVLSLPLLFSILPTPSSSKLDCVLPKPKVVVTKNCHFVDGTSWVTQDCKEMHFGLPKLSTFDPLTTETDCSWYYTFAERLVLNVADSPPWAVVQEAVRGNITGKQLTSQLWTWQLSHHLIVSILVCAIAGGCVVWSIGVCVRFKRKRRHRLVVHKRLSNCQSAVVAGYISLLVLIAIFVIVSTAYMTRQWRGSRSTAVANAARHNLDAYVNNTINIASHLVNHQLNFLLGTATERLDRLGHLVANQASWLVFNATNDVSEAVLDIVNKSHITVDALNQINGIEKMLIQYQTSIVRQLEIVKEQTATIDCTIVNSTMAACSQFSDNITDLMYVGGDYRKLPNVTLVATIAKQVYDSDLSNQAAAVWPKFQGIPCTIQSNVAAFLVDAKAEVVKLHSDVVGKVNDLFPDKSGNDVNTSTLDRSSLKSTDTLHKVAGSESPSKTAPKRKHHFSLIEKGNTSALESFWLAYGWERLTTKILKPVRSSFSILASVNSYISLLCFSSITMLLLLLIIPVLFSVSKLRWVSAFQLHPLAFKRSSPVLKFYMAAVPIVITLLLVSVAFLYFVAGTAGVFCQPLNSMDFLNETIDNVPSVYPNHILNKYVLPPGSPPMTIRELLDDCKQNQSLYHTLRLNQRVNIHHLFNMSKVRDLVDRHLNKASSAFTIDDKKILSVQAQIALLRLHSNTSGLKSISFKKFDTACRTHVLSSSPKSGLQWLYLVMNEVSVLAAASKNSTDPREHQLLQLESLKLVTLRSELATLVHLVEQANGELIRMCEDIAVIKRILHSAVDQIPMTLDLADNLGKTLQRKAPRLVQELMDSYVSDLYSWANSFFNFSIDLISNKLGNCKPVTDIWLGVVNTACGSTAPGLNSVWLMTLLCALLCLPTVMLVPRLAHVHATSLSDEELMIENMDTYAVALDDVNDDGMARVCSAHSNLLDLKDDA